MAPNRMNDSNALKKAQVRDSRMEAMMMMSGLRKLKEVSMPPVR